MVAELSFPDSKYMYERKEIFDKFLVENKYDEINEVFLNECYWGDLNTVKYMIDNGANPRYKDDAPFVCACSNRIDMASYFLTEWGADINAYNGVALGAAASNHRLKTMVFLLKNGINVTDEAIKEAVKWDGDDNIEVLLSCGVSPQRIAPFVFSEYVFQNKIAFNMIKSLHKHGLDLNQTFDELFKH